MWLRVAFFLLLLAPVVALAQGCPQGIPQGAPGCIPPTHPNSPLNNGAPAAPAVVQGYWQTNWAAVAFDESTANGGTSTGHRSRRAAEKEAMRKCKAMGGKACYVLLSYGNQCAAIAYPASGEAWKHPFQMLGLTLQEAQDKANQACAEKNGQPCKVVYSNCAEAILAY